MRRRSILRWSVLALALACGGCGRDDSAPENASANRPATDATGSGASAGKARVTIFAAASLTDVLPRVLAEWESSRPDIEIVVSFGSSAQLARQIQAGAPADLFLSADAKWASEVTASHPQSKSAELAGNSLVVIVPSEGPPVSGTTADGSPFARLVDESVERVALANPDGVPAGIHAKQALVKAGVWDRVENKLAIADDVRQALAFVARGEADAGIVYATDALGRGEVRVLADVPPDLHEPIRQTWVLLDPAHAAAAAIFEGLGAEKSRREFEAAGFRWLGK